MPKAEEHRKKVKRLHDVEAVYVSLVDHPANKTPFKFIKRAGAKSEEAMNHSLLKMFGSRSPAVTSVIAKSQARAEALAKVLMPDAKEFTITKEGDVVQVRNSATPETEGEQVIHEGEKTGVAYTVANLDKALSLYDMDSTSFDEVVQKEGFVPGLMTGLDALHSTIANIAMSEEVTDADQFKKQVGDAIDAFSNYMDGLITSLPQTAFKFEKALIAVRSPNFDAANGVPGAFDAETYDAIFGDEKPADGQEATAGGDTSDATADPAEPSEGGAQAAQSEAGEAGSPSAEAATGEAGAGDTASASQAAQDDPAPANLEELPKGEGEATDLEKVVAEAMAALTKSLEPQFKAITDSVGALSEKVDANDGKVEALSKSLGSTVATTPDTDEGGGNVVEIRKGAEGGEPPLLDTAFAVNRG